MTGTHTIAYIGTPLHRSGQEIMDNAHVCSDTLTSDLLNFAIFRVTCNFTLASIRLPF